MLLSIRAQLCQEPASTLARLSSNSEPTNQTCCSLSSRIMYTHDTRVRIEPRKILRLVLPSSFSFYQHPAHFCDRSNRLARSCCTVEPLHIRDWYSRLPGLGLHLDRVIYWVAGPISLLNSAGVLRLLSLFVLLKVTPGRFVGSLSTCTCRSSSRTALDFCRDYCTPRKCQLLLCMALALRPTPFVSA